MLLAPPAAPTPPPTATEPPYHAANVEPASLAPAPAVKPLRLSVAASYSTAFGIGFGASFLGYLDGLTLGASFAAHPAYAPAGPTDVSMTTLYGGGELGYEMWLAPAIALHGYVERISTCRSNAWPTLA